MKLSQKQIPPEFRSGPLLPEPLIRRYLGFCGKGVKIYQGCRLFPPEKIFIGDRTQIDEGVFIFAGEGVQIGQHVHLAWGCGIFGGGQCYIGDFAGISSGVRLVTGTESVRDSNLTNPTVPAPFRLVQRDRVEIGAHVLLFTNTIVFPGVRIGEGAVVAAGSVVHRHLRPWRIYAGHPLVEVGPRPRRRHWTEAQTQPNHEF